MYARKNAATEKNFSAGRAIDKKSGIYYNI